MHISRTVENIEKLIRLGHGAKQRIVAAGAFLLLVKAHGGALDTAFGGLNRAVEIECYTSKIFSHQRL